MPFQTRVNRYLPLGVEGDFASANPRASVITSEGGLIAGPAGVTVGRFAWIMADGKTVTNFAQGARKPDGYIRRAIDALITAYLGESSNLIPAGFPVTLFDAGEFLVKVRGAASTVNGSVFASYLDGTPVAGAAPAGATATGSIGATFTATAAGNQLTTSAVTGLISVGDTIAGTGVPAGTTILNQVSGTTGGAGVYTTSAVTTATAVTVTSFGIVLNVSAVATGVLAPGDALTGTGVPALATIETQVSGAVGGVGVYTLNIPATAYAASTALTVVGGIATSFNFKTVAIVGDLAKISTWGN